MILCARFNERLHTEAEVKAGEIRPTNIVPAVSIAGLAAMQWGFPRYDGKGIIINARSETAAVKPMFAAPFAQHRCLLPASYLVLNGGRRTIRRSSTVFFLRYFRYYIWRGSRRQGTRGSFRVSSYSPGRPQRALHLCMTGCH